jgi:hypothetical protein
MTDDWVSVGPGRQGMDALRKELEALAHHSSDVRTAGAADEFLIPPYLADLYNRPPVVQRARRTKKEGDE